MFEEEHTNRVSVNLAQFRTMEKWVTNAILDLVDNYCNPKNIVIQMPLHLSRYLFAETFRRFYGYGSKNNEPRMRYDAFPIDNITAFTCHMGTFPIIQGYEMKVVVFDTEKQGYAAHDPTDTRYCKQLPILATSSSQKPL